MMYKIVKELIGPDQDIPEVLEELATRVDDLCLMGFKPSGGVTIWPATGDEWGGVCQVLLKEPTCLD